MPTRLLARGRFASVVVRRFDVGREQRNPDREVHIDASPTVLALANSAISPSQEVASAEEVARIEQAFTELPEDYREAISLQRLCEMDYAEIAARMNRSEGAVRNLVYRGLSRLALRLTELRSGEDRENR